MNVIEFAETMNNWGREKVPFLFAVDFEMEKPWIIPLKEVDSSRILFSIGKESNAKHAPRQVDVQLKTPTDFKRYAHKFDIVMRALEYGDTFLTNLTIKSEIASNVSLRDIFLTSKANYKLLVEDEFLVFSPETFVRIRDGKIFSYPMKGTIDADLPNAAETILSDKKELAEHVTIVDLIRNDISRVARNVRVTRFRYLEKLRTNRKNLLQVSSEITGDLSDKALVSLGDTLISLLPAGSVSGAPKDKTLEIIRTAEGEKRGFYTGVFGYFNGSELDSGVMIRFIEKDGDKLFYRSGGGITTQSVVSSEYQEAIDKVYVPVD